MDRRSVAISWMGNIGAYIPLGTFAWNVVILTGGTAIGQLISTLASPVLTRLYAPSDFGLLASYMAFVSIISVFSTGRYDMAVPLPRSDIEAAALVFVSIKICMLTSVLSLVLFVVSGFFFTSELIPWLYILPISVFVIGVYNTFQFWFNRREKYQIMSISRVLNSFSTAFMNILLGLVQIKGGQIWGTLIGQMVTVVWMAAQIGLNDISFFRNANLGIQNYMLKRYASHPVHIVPSHLIGTIASQIPVLIMSHVYSLTTTGFFSLAYRMITLPTLLIANAIGDVYRQKIAKRYNEYGEFRTIFTKTLKVTFVLALPLFSIFYLTVPVVFPVVFGEAWRTAGEYARILVIGAFFQFIFTPIDKGALVVGATRYIFFWHFARLTLMLLLWFFAERLGLSVYEVLWGLVGINSALYLIDGLVGFILATGRRAL